MQLACKVNILFQENLSYKRIDFKAKKNSYLHCIQKVNFCLMSKKPIERPNGAPCKCALTGVNLGQVCPTNFAKCGDDNGLVRQKNAPETAQHTLTNRINIQRSANILSLGCVSRLWVQGGSQAT